MSATELARRPLDSFLEGLRPRSSISLFLVSSLNAFASSSWEGSWRERRSGSEDEENGSSVAFAFRRVPRSLPPNFEMKTRSGEFSLRF